MLRESEILCIPPPGIFRGYPHEATCHVTKDKSILCFSLNLTEFVSLIYC